MEQQKDSLGIEQKDLTGATPLEIAEEIVRILDSRKAGDIRLLHVTEKTVITDYFVICSGGSNTQVRGLSGEVEYRLGLDGLTPSGIDGEDSANWIVLDYSSVMVHIFQRESREFYRLDRLWNEAEEVDLSSVLTED